jgi:uncharacterized membrane protein
LDPLSRRTIRSKMSSNQGGGGAVMQDALDASQMTLGVSYEALDERADKVARHVTKRTPIAKNIAREFDQNATRGQRAADAVATFGGSWVFLLIFATTMLVWVVLNSLMLVRYQKTFDPYPYILLNLFLSMLAAVQAPIILMSQNRHAEKDRIHAEHDYEVNLKAELEIMLLHDKLDLLREGQWGELLGLQKQQLHFLERLLEKKMAT